MVQPSCVHGMFFLGHQSECQLQDASQTQGKPKENMPCHSNGPCTWFNKKNSTPGTEKPTALAVTNHCDAVSGYYLQRCEHRQHDRHQVNTMQLHESSYHTHALGILTKVKYQCQDKFVCNACARRFTPQSNVVEECRTTALPDKSFT